MKKEYDFSNAERGKFFKESAEYNLPVYLDPENLEFVKSIAKANETDISEIVNKLIRENIKIAKVLR